MKTTLDQQESVMPVILYAEDEPEQAAMMRMYIHRKTPFTLIEATDGREAVEKIKTERPDLILLDLFIPRLDGFGVLRTIKSNEQTARIPVIILSAWPSSANRKRAEQEGAAKFVAKPYEPAYLMMLIEKYLALANVS